MDIYRELAEVLIEKQVITQADYEQAVLDRQQKGGQLFSYLIANGALSEEDFLKFLAVQLKIPLFDLKNFSFDPMVSKQLSEPLARQFKALVLKETENSFLVGMVDPLNINALDELKKVLKKPLEVALVKQGDLDKAINSIYRRTDEISNYAKQLKAEISDHEFDIEEADSEVDSPVIRLLKSVFEDAVQVGASDIHIEPGEDKLRIRLRVDGVLQEQIIPETKIANAIIVRLKLMSNLDISEKRIPQDGRLHIKVRGKAFDVRLSTLPTQHGESAVMRLLDKSSGPLDLNKAGMSEDTLKRFQRLLTVPHGIILVTGPTGSGKSTTLYSVLSRLNQAGTKILTVEDPVEYELERVCQVQINSKVGLTFASVLRAALRQDPDIVMVGEMRDQETASIAVRAALTGHLVFSTLHTNDAASSVVRLMDMDVPGFMVAATLRGVVAQRLIRKVCHQCTVPVTLNENERVWLESIASQEEVNKIQPVQGEGCSYCNRTGYAGRLGLYELLELNPQMMEALRQNDPSVFMDHANHALKGKLLLDEALAMIVHHKTTVEEAMRVLGGY